MLGAVHPNAGIELRYRRLLERLIDDMNRSALYWITAYWRANTPLMAADANPVAALIRMVRGLGRRWQKKFKVAAEEMADYFATAIKDRADGAMAAILRKGGFTVGFRLTAKVRDVLTAATEENVSLIKTIPAQHFARIEQMVMRSAQTGRDLKQLTDDLEKSFKVTRARAAFIARDQTNKATAVILRTRQLEVGVTKARWLHSGGGNEPRPEHVKWSGKEYDVAKGMWSEVDQAWVWPGTAINCRCVTQSIVPGYDQ